MILVENNLQSWTDEEILTLISINNAKKLNYDKALSITKYLNPIMETINNKRRKCNDVIEKEYYISKESGDMLVKESKEIKKLNSETTKLRENLSECEKENSRLNLISEKLLNIVNSCDSTNKNNKKNEHFYIIDEIKELRKIEKNLENDIKLFNETEKMFKEKELKETDYRIVSMDLKDEIKKLNKLKQEKENNIIIYNQIKEHIDFIMKYDYAKITNKKKHCSSKQYRKFISEICTEIRRRNSLIMNLKSKLPSYLVSALSNLYEFESVKIVTDKLYETKEENIEEIKPTKKRLILGRKNRFNSCNQDLVLQG